MEYPEKIFAILYDGEPVIGVSAEDLNYHSDVKTGVEVAVYTRTGTATYNAGPSIVETQPATKRRGRPAGSKNKPKPAAVQAQPTEKKKRGRPRKIQSSEVKQ